MTPQLKTRVRKLIQERNLLRKHNRELINIYLHHYELRHRIFARRRELKIANKRGWLVN